MSLYKSAGPYLLHISAQPSIVPVYEGQRAAIQVSITLAAHPNLTLGMSLIIHNFCGMFGYVAHSEDKYLSLLITFIFVVHETFSMHALCVNA